MTFRVSIKKNIFILILLLQFLVSYQSCYATFIKIIKSLIMRILALNDANATFRCYNLI